MTRRRRYHRDIGLPPGIELAPRGAVPLVWSAHALQELRNDTHLPAPASLLPTATCVEVTVNEDGSVWRWLQRQPLSAHQDICLVLEGNRVVTCWTNYTTDTHKTLRRELYDIPNGDMR